ncbi:MAG TPA: carbohydrate kinase family protein [Methanospirillum sp.]|uniref:carbohydrate kinase family protein n=1 Tax=Methanospirillum sp. TaxID=45200 RepID=UPI002B6FA474|nr:carbohydrate kinase family protein [Methanospirillum sp.]HWQ64323.1 carbohydrate kinase family protein [Methanospirillum sp.]
MIEVVGHTAVDHICKVSHLPLPNASASVLERKVFFGGGAANIAAGISVLGGDVALISAVGGEFAGSEYDRWMDKLKIDKRFFVVPTANTATAFMFTDPQGAQMTFFEWGASRAFETEQAPKLEFVHMATADPAFNVRVAEKAEFASFDPGQDIHRYTREHLQVILENIDILIANHHEYSGMCKTLGISHADLIKQVPIAIETRSAEGCQITEQGNTTTIPAVTVSCVDPTGAGDGFRAGFLTAYAEGYDTITSAKIGTITASFVVEHVGCQTALADRARMKDRYTDTFGKLSEPQRPRRT